MFAPDGWKNFVDQYKADVDSGGLALVVADTLTRQIQLLKEGYAHSLVGQRPYEMSKKAMDTLLVIKNGVRRLNKSSTPAMTWLPPKMSISF